MTQTHSLRPLVRIVALTSLLLGVVWGLAEGAGSARQYPDLRAVPADDLVLGTEMMNGVQHNVVRFSTTVWNAGEGPLELRGDSSSGESHVYQRIYHPGGSVAELLAGTFAFHDRHAHWHFENFARYELWTQGRYDQWLDGETDGQPDWLGSKTTGLGESYCLRDSRPMDGQAAAVFRYATCNTDIQGISVGWSDVYGREIPGQWVDVGERPLVDGNYVLRIVVDPLNLIYESENRANPERESAAANEAVTRFSLSGGLITLASR